jgi:two-component system osmolarity sensor histidine kinase EnvZ
MVEAAHRIGEGDFSAHVPENGPRELAKLAHKLNRMEGRIAQLLDNRTTLLAGISHDLRTPLARMRLELEMLKGDENTALVDDLNDDITEMENLISRTLQLARGLAHEPAQMVDVVSLVQTVVTGFQQAGHPVGLKTSPACQYPIPGGALRQVLNNLIENAVSHGGDEPVVVELDCSPEREDVELRVIDRGPGIPAEQREAIFEPFHRLDASRSRSTGGSGLGLAVVRQLCLAYGWKIDIDTAEGQRGACFRVRLPRKTVADRVAD